MATVQLFPSPGTDPVSRSLQVKCVGYTVISHLKKRSSDVTELSQWKITRGSTVYGLTHSPGMHVGTELSVHYGHWPHCSLPLTAQWEQLLGPRAVRDCPAARPERGLAGAVEGQCARPLAGSSLTSGDPAWVSRI